MTESIIFSLLRTAIGSASAESLIAADLNEDVLAAVCALANRHDLAHLLGHALDKIGWNAPTALSQTLHKQTMTAIYRCARQEHEFEQAACLFENAGISYIPLKGTVIRRWYPEPWMRTSTDIDILIHKEDLDIAISLLTEKLGYRHEGTEFHDASLHSPSGVHLELHYSLVDSTIPSEMRHFFADVWDHVTPVTGESCRFDMDEDWFYLYHIFHMTKHLVNGGCGIKPFLDLWIMKQKVGYCAKRFEPLLDSCGLLTAARESEKLAEIWFSGREMDDVSRRLARFVLDGGVHGTVEGNVVIGQARNGGKFQGIRQKVFLSYDLMKELYPILIKHKWLLPALQVVRWCKLLFGGRFRRTANVLWKNVTTSGSVRDDAAKLLQDLDLYP